MSYLSTASPAGCSQERVMDVGDWEGEAKLVGVDGGTVESLEHVKLITTV